MSEALMFILVESSKSDLNFRYLAIFGLRFYNLQQVYQFSVFWFCRVYSIIVFIWFENLIMSLYKSYV